MMNYKNTAPEQEPFLKKKEKAPQEPRGWFGSLLSGDEVGWEMIQQNTPYILFLFVLLLFYIGNRHYTEGLVISIDKMDKELKELRWEYMTNKAELMYRSNQSEVAKRVAPMGLEESVVPPQKIVD